MKKRLIVILIMAGLLAVLAVSAGIAGMSNANYQITTTVMSGGGGPMVSAGYQLNGTQGQPSPLMDPADPPYSTNYDLYPGFLYTLVTSPLPTMAVGLAGPEGKGYVEVVQAIPPHDHLAWARVHWPVYNTSNGETRPGLK
jgi:hypothetical protein